MKNWLIKLVALFLLLPFASLSLAAQVTYYDTNNVGTPVAMWDASARKVWETEYYPFGKEYRTSPAVTDNSRKFIGKEKDKETDLTYFGARYYDDLSGRFLAPDPVRPVNALTSKTNQEILNNPKRLNRYAYGLNNPYKYVDPDGKFPVILAFVAAKAIAMGVAYVGLQAAATAAPEARGDINSAMVEVAKINAGQAAGMAAGEVVGAALGMASKGVDALSKAAGAADRGGLTAAGRSLQKHGGRQGSAFPAAKGNPTSINQQGQNIVDDILTSTGSVTSTRHHARYGNVTEVRAPDGRGVRYDSKSNFMGFLEPKK